MPFFKYIPLVFTICFSACHSTKKSEKKAVLSDCLKLKIEAFSKSDCKNGLSVKEYVFSGKHVYAFDPGNCGADMTTEVVDEHCKTLGYLGGIMGNTEIEGMDFSKAELVKSLYE